MTPATERRITIALWALFVIFVAMAVAGIIGKLVGA